MNPRHPQTGFPNLPNGYGPSEVQPAQRIFEAFWAGEQGFSLTENKSLSESVVPKLLIEKWTA